MCSSAWSRLAGAGEAVGDALGDDEAAGDEAAGGEAAATTSETASDEGAADDVGPTVAPEVALRAINGSSGRSLQTQERLPQAVLTRNFDYGFKLGLMLKDVDIALSDVS